MSGEPLTDEELMRLFEAARWAPSTYNEQEWRFLYVRRDTPQWPLFFDLLYEANQSWCKNAAVLVVIARAQDIREERQTESGLPFRCRLVLGEPRAASHCDGPRRAWHGRLRFR